VHSASRGTYGARRVRAELTLGLGLHVGHNQVESSTMQEAIDIGLARSGAEPGPGPVPPAILVCDRRPLFTTKRPRDDGQKSEVTDMALYLMQHGQATTETENPERPLTDAGRAAVQRVAQSARAADVRISGCLHSGKLRAEQTAQLLAREIGVEPSVEARAGLAPNDPVLPVAQWLRTQTEHQSLALVGHMPFLGRLASLLVAGDEQAQVVGFQMGGLLKLEPKVDRDGFLVAWALPPALA